MAREPLEALAAALHDEALPIRLGAIRASIGLAPEGAVELLSARAAEEDMLPPEESAVLALALADGGHDSSDILARLLNADQNELCEALQSDHDSWTRYANGLVARLNAPAWPYGLLNSYWRAWNTRQQSWLARQLIDDAALARNALSEFEFWSADWVAGREGQRRAKQVFTETLELLRAEDVGGAGLALAQIAVTEPDGWMRIVAQHMAPPLRSAAATPLLATLGGATGPRPGFEVYRSIAQEAGLRAFDELEPEPLAAFLAGRALENFSDEGTAFAVINAALHWTGEPRARASRVLARMSAEAALAPLTWSAGNLPSRADRDTAYDLLGRIVESDETLGIRLHRIGSEEFGPGHLGWLLNLARNPGGLPAWARDQSIALPILRNAIAIMPEIVGEAGYIYSEPPTAASASSFKRSIDAIASWIGFGRSSPAESQQRFPELTFPAACRQGSTETLSIKLTLTRTVDGGPSMPVPFEAGQDAVDLLVLVHAPGFWVSPDHRVLRVPRQASSAEVAFALRAHTLGDQAIDVKFLLGTATIGHFTVMTRIGIEAPASPEPGQTIPFDPFGAEALDTHGVAQAVLRATTEPDGHLAWSMILPDRPQLPLGRSPKAPTAGDAREWLEQQGRLIRDILQPECDADSLRGVMRQLSAIGSHLFTQIAPDRLASKLDELPDRALVVIDSDADWVPWELLASDPNSSLWGERFVLVRAPMAVAEKAARFVKPGRLSEAFSRAVLVIGDDISDKSRLGRLTFGSMSRYAEPLLIEPNWTALEQGIAGADIVHFACHGRSSPFFHLSIRAGQDGRLLAPQAYQLGLKWGSVVFANACSAMAGHPMLAGFLSFGQDFFFAGARPFIGTLGPVPEQEAVAFAGLFYEEFAVAGLPAGEALRNAKRRASEQLKRPVWLFYGMYGNPAVSRSWRPA